MNREQKIKVDVSGRQKTLVVARTCNNRCIMCHSPCQSRDEFSQSTVMNAVLGNVTGTEEIIQLSGGEPTIRKDLPMLIETIRRQSPAARIVINSNGRLFCYRGFAERLSRHKGIVSVKTDLHGDSPELHDSITQVPGSFKQTCCGIQNLLDIGISISIVVLVHKMNYRKVPLVAEHIKRFGKRTYVEFIFTWLRGRAYENRKQLFVSASSTAPYLQKAADILGEQCRFMHFPPCIFSEEYRKYAGKQMFKMPNREDYPSGNCSNCRLKETCSGIWKNYSLLAGGLGEFVPPA